MGLWEVLAPEHLPASDGPAIGAEACGELTDAAWCGPLPHGADQNDDGAQVNLGAEEAYRRRCHSFPAVIAIAAKAESDSLWLG
jgi:hypothetical protein